METTTTTTTTEKTVDMCFTEDYSLFKTLKGNRLIDYSHIENLKDSMKENYLINPIMVNENMEVIDGQHRLEACKSLGYPVYFIINKGWGIAEAHSLNVSQKNWTTVDYLTGYCELGSEEYLKFRGLLNKYEMIPFSIVFTCALLRKSRADGRYINKFKMGDFKFQDFEKSENLLKDLYSVKEYYSGYNKSSFCLAILRCLDVKGFSFDSFIDKLKIKRADMIYCTSIQSYMPVIESIYNYRRSANDKIRLY